MGGLRITGRSIWALASIGLLAVPAACDPDERDMPERMEMPDTMAVMRAMDDEEAMDSLMDVMPGGEMARGDSAAAMELLKMKMESGGR
jgi:hypothetical protein